MLQARKFRLRAQIGKHRRDAGVGAGDRAVDALMGEKQGSLDAILVANGLQRFAEFGETREGDEMIERCDHELAMRLGARGRGNVGHGSCKYSFRAASAIRTALAGAICRG
ncbi:hypothetical protein D3C71_1930490 [compost metagenome]